MFLFSYVYPTLLGGYGKVQKGKPVTDLCRKDLAVNAAATVKALVGLNTSTPVLTSTSKKFSAAAKAKKFCENSALEKVKRVTRGRHSVEEHHSDAATVTGDNSHESNDDNGVITRAVTRSSKRRKK